MGGRGSWSASHGGMKASVHGASGLWVSKEIESREDIRQLFINELGFKELYGTEGIPTAQLASLAIQLKQSEKLYGTLSNNDVYLSVTNRSGVKGAAGFLGDGSMIMFVNPQLHSSVSSYRRTLQNEQKSGFKTQTDGAITNDFSYTARHEYGHLTQFSITNTTGKSATQIRSEVSRVAVSRYNAKSNAPSGYGATNDAEFFAESFASMTGGKPNAYGKALSDWLRSYRKR